MNNTVIGLTGQTGAGKSTIADYAQEHSCRIVDADIIAREVLGKGSPCLKRLAEIFGYDIIDEEGCCRRKLLAERAFSSVENTEVLNRMTHARITELAGEYINRYKNEDGVIIYDCPLLFESGGDSLCDIVVAVAAPDKIRLQRIIARDGITEHEAMLRIKAQKDEEFYRKRADYVIDGSMDKERVLSQFGELLRKIARKEV